MQRSRLLLPFLSLALALAAPLAAQAIPSATGFTTSSIATPGTATGDIVVVGDTVFVGIGDFGVGAQSVVRIDAGGGTTVLADGFNSLGGFAYDPINDRLVVADNGGNGPGALTGDTVYAIVDPFGSPATPAAAASIELLPQGSIPGAADIVLDPTDASGDTIFVSDASEDFPLPNGRILEVSISSGTSSVLQSGLAFAAGLAVDDDTLYVGELALDFSGVISTVALSDPTAALSTLAAGLGGQFDIEVTSDGTLLASTGGEVIAVFPDGTTASFAGPFGFATSLDVSGGIVYALDGFPATEDLNKIWVFTPVPEPGAALLFGTGLAVVGWRRRA